MSGHLVPWPRRAWLAIVVCLVVVGSMGVAFHDKNHGTPFDVSVDGWIHHHGQSLWKTLIHVTDPATVTVLYLILIVWAVVLRRWDVVTLAVFTPPATILSVEFVLKPWVHRLPTGDLAVFGGNVPLAYPSGHESGIGSFLAVSGLLVVASAWPLWRKLAVLGAILVVALVASVALVGRYYHYATDTIGSIFFSIAVVLVVGLIVDALAAWERRGHADD